MTFKHVKFQDSPVMRSLEKVAKEKGLVKEEDLVKTASKKIDLSPGGNLFVNLLKLSEGLRDAGFDKFADELESKAVAYKQAQTLYETTKEKGEDLVDAAHPKGSHKLEDVDGDEAVFETIVDQQLQNIKTVNKEPTGKLASSEDILKNVRIVLGQNSDFLAGNLDRLYAKALNDLQSFSRGYQAILRVLGKDPNFEASFFKGLERQLSGKKVYEVDDEFFNLNRAVENLKEEFSPGFFSSFNEKNKWKDEIEPMINKLTAQVNPGEFTKTIIQIRRLESENRSSSAVNVMDPNAGTVTLPEVTVVGDPNSIDSRVKGSLSKINSYKSQIGADLELTQQQKDAVNKWLDGRAALFNSQLKSYNNIPEEEKGNASTRLVSNLNKLDAQLKSFYDKWIA